MRLPRLRRRLRKDLASSGLPKDKVLAVVVTLLDDTLIRVGNEEYARANSSYGLTTLRVKHVQFLRDGRASFCFRGKAGRKHDVVLDDKRLTRIIRRIQQLPGQQLFQYVDDDGKRQPIDSGMVNDYLRRAMNGANGDAPAASFTAKDFRTWGATLRALEYLTRRKCDPHMSQTGFNKCVTQTARHVAEALCNTPAVCRKSYINPAVFAAWRNGVITRLAQQKALSSKAMEGLAIRVLRLTQK